MRVRVAQSEDVEKLVEMNGALFREDAGTRDPCVSLDWPEREGREYFGALVSDGDSLCLLAEVGGEAAGYLAGRLCAETSMRPVKTAELESLYIFQSHRGLGFGAELTREFLNWSRSRGAQVASVTAYAENERAINFYEKSGFRPRRVSLETNI